MDFPQQSHTYISYGCNNFVTSKTFTASELVTLTSGSKNLAAHYIILTLWQWMVVYLIVFRKYTCCGPFSHASILLDMKSVSCCPYFSHVLDVLQYSSHRNMTLKLSHTYIYIDLKYQESPEGNVSFIY